MIGYEETYESAPGVWMTHIVEKSARGDVQRASRRWEDGQNANGDFMATNTLSIVADSYISQHTFAIRYVRWLGGVWKVSSVEQAYPRLTLTLGGVYTGDTA